MTFPAIFGILVGFGMIGQWTFSYISKQIPELETERVRVLFHIAAELITAVALIVGGVGLLGGWPWGVPLYLIATGMLIYTMIVSPGYFAQKGQYVWLGIFGALLVLTLVSIGVVLRSMGG
jgi:hypothetical protein